MSDNKYIVLKTPDSFIPDFNGVRPGPGAIRMGSPGDELTAAATKKVEVQEMSLT